MSINPATPEFPHGTVTVKMHRRKPLHLVVDRRELEGSLVAEMEMQRTENSHLKRKLGERAREIENYRKVLGLVLDRGPSTDVEQAALAALSWRENLAMVNQGEGS